MRSSADLAQGTHLVRAREINGDPTLVSGVAGASTLAETFLSQAVVDVHMRNGIVS